MTAGKALSAITSTWIACPDPKPRARLRLFCFPYAGSGTARFQVWSRLLSQDIELCSVKLPGREARLKEVPYRQLSPLVEALAVALRPFMNKPFAFFGHSMGALISFEMARELRRQYGIDPVHLFVSGHNAPHLPDPNPPLHQLPDDVFVEKLKQLYDGTPAEILQNDALMQLFLPTLRADFSILETYVYKDAPLLDTPISAFGGRQDSETTEEGLVAWRDQTQSGFSLSMFPGDHFFLQSDRAALLQTLARDLAWFLVKPKGV